MGEIKGSGHAPKYVSNQVLVLEDCGQSPQTRQGTTDCSLVQVNVEFSDKGTHLQSVSYDVQSGYKSKTSKEEVMMTKQHRVVDP